MKEEKYRALNSVLTEIRSLQAEEKNDKAMVLIGRLAEEAYGDNGNLNVTCGLGGLADDQLKKIKTVYGFVASDALEDILQDILSWLCDGVLLNTENRCLTSYLANRVTYDGRSCHVTDVQHSLGITSYTDKGSMRTVSHQSSEIKDEDGNVHDIWDMGDVTPVGSGLISRSPEDIVVGDTSDMACITEAVRDSVAKATIDFLDKKKKIDAVLFINFCIDTEYNKNPVFIMSYASCEKAMRCLREWGRNKWFTDVEAELKSRISKDDAEDIMSKLRTWKWNDGNAGLRRLIITSVAAYADKTMNNRAIA